MNITAVFGLGLALSLPLAVYAAESETALAKQPQSVNSASESVGRAPAGNGYDTGYVNMSATYPLNAETFVIKCHKTDGKVTVHDLVPLHGYSTYCKTSDVYEKSGSLVQAGIGHGCHFIWGKIPLFHPNSSVSDGTGCPDMITAGNAMSSDQLDMQLFSKPPFPNLV